jgi:BRCT domain type II
VCVLYLVGWRVDRNKLERTPPRARHHAHEPLTRTDHRQQIPHRARAGHEPHQKPARTKPSSNGTTTPTPTTSAAAITTPRPNDPITPTELLPDTTPAPPLTPPNPTTTTPPKTPIVFSICHGMLCDLFRWRLFVVDWGGGRACVRSSRALVVLRARLRWVCPSE